MVVAAADASVDGPVAALRARGVRVRTGFLEGAPTQPSFHTHAERNAPRGLEDRPNHRWKIAAATGVSVGSGARRPSSGPDRLRAQSDAITRDRWDPERSAATTQSWAPTAGPRSDPGDSVRLAEFSPSARVFPADGLVWSGDPVRRPGRASKTVIRGVVIGVPGGRAGRVEVRGALEAWPVAASVN